MKAIALVTILALVFATNCWVYEGHDIRGEASKAVYDGIKSELITFAPSLSNKNEGAALKKDLEQSDPKKLQMKELSLASVGEIFKHFGLKTPECDTNKNSKVDGDELKCLGKLWKYYVPK